MESCTVLITFSFLLSERLTKSGRSAMLSAFQVWSALLRCPSMGLSLQWHSYRSCSWGSPGLAAHCTGKVDRCWQLLQIEQAWRCDICGVREKQYQYVWTPGHCVGSCNVHQRFQLWYSGSKMATSTAQRAGRCVGLRVKGIQQPYGEKWCVPTELLSCWATEDMGSHSCAHGEDTQAWHCQHWWSN